MGFCKNHGELSDLKFFIRKGGYIPSLCCECEREAARLRRRDRYANLQTRSVIKTQNILWKRSNATLLADKERQRCKSRHEIDSCKYTSNEYTSNEYITSIRCGGYLPIYENQNLIFKRLSNTFIRNPLPQSYVGLNYLDNIFCHRFFAKTAGMRSFHESFHDDLSMTEVINYIVKSDRIPTKELIIRNLKFNCSIPSHFFPEAAASIYKEFAFGKDSFDPFLGWGGRALGAVCAGVKSIIGTDLSAKSVSGCRQIIEDFRSLSSTVGIFHEVDAIKYMSETSDRFDFILTSPPFLDTEDYGHGTFRSAREWVEQIAIPLAKLSRRILRLGGRIAIHAQDRPKMPVLSSIVASFNAAGFEVDTEYHYGKRQGQSVIIYRIVP